MNGEKNNHAGLIALGGALGAALVALGWMAAILLAGSYLKLAPPAQANGNAPRTYAVPASYKVLTDLDGVAIVVPQTTSEEEDQAAVRDLARQINAGGRDALIAVCAESNLFPGAYDCPLVFLFAR